MLGASAIRFAFIASVSISVVASATTELSLVVGDRRRLKSETKRFGIHVLCRAGGVAADASSGSSVLCRALSRVYYLAY